MALNVATLPLILCHKVKTIKYGIIRTSCNFLSLVPRLLFFFYCIYAENDAWSDCTKKREEPRFCFFSLPLFISSFLSSHFSSARFSLLLNFPPLFFANLKKAKPGNEATISYTCSAVPTTFF